VANVKKSSIATAIPTEAKQVSKASAPETVQTKPKSVEASPGKAAAGKTSPVKSVSKKAPAKRPVSKAPAIPKVAEKAVKAKKPKLVRDSFTIPKAEFAVLEELKQRAAKLTRPVKKSELIRAGIKALAALSNAAFLTALNQVPTIKTGRPAL
jgi:hypothetical protein